jgi:hypothetical protein
LVATEVFATERDYLCVDNVLRTTQELEKEEEKQLLTRKK